MKLWNRLAGFSLAIVVISAAGLASAQEPTAGVVRISDNVAVGEQLKQQSYSMHSSLVVSDCDTQTPGCDPQVGSYQCEDCRECDYGCCWKHKTWQWICHPFCADDCYQGHRCRSNCPPDQCPHCRNGNCPYHGHSKSGHGYKATRGVAPFGCYTMAYPVNPDYCDGRDGSLYAAQGYGINVTVPLAPNVGAAYNYGWGVPSSRLTPISNPLPVPPMSSPMHGPSPIVIRNR